MTEVGRSAKTGCFFGVGAGSGDPGLLTVRAVEILRTVDVVFHVAGVNTKKSVSGSVVDSVEGCNAERIKLVFAMAKDMEDRKAAWAENADIIAAELKKGRDCAFVTIGDPLVYSTYSYILAEVEERVPGLHVETVPGITSFQTVAARSNRPLVEDSQVLAVVPAWTKESQDHPVLDSADTVVLLKTYRHRDEIIETLKKKGIAGDVVYASRVGLDREFITDDLDEAAASPEEYLSMMIIKKQV